MRKSVELFDRQDKKVVTVADREAVIYGLFLLAEVLGSNYLIRAPHNKKINKSAIHSNISGEMLWDFMKKQKIIGKLEVNVPATDINPKRTAVCNIKIGRFNLLPPRSFKGVASRGSELTLHSIQIVEEKTPKGGQ